MPLRPLRRRAVFVVGEHVVVVRVQPGQHGAPAGAAHRRRDEAVGELGALLPQVAVQLRHELQRAELNVLVVAHDQHDVGAAAAAVEVRGEEALDNNPGRGSVLSAQSEAAKTVLIVQTSTLRCCRSSPHAACSS